MDFLYFKKCEKNNFVAPTLEKNVTPTQWEGSLLNLVSQTPLAIN